ncbi:MAG: TRAP transporter substrate-binding protein DctP [Deltaproteobacteria bacterium]|nr:TRAP transporter substrate-binding protein DctP [Deltaproteobacteria bacterium]
MKNSIYSFLALFLLTGLVFGHAIAPQATAAPVEFKCVAFAPVHEETIKTWWKGMEMINNKFKGQVLFKLTGGPEVVSPFEQHGATMKGIVDVCILPPSFYRGKLPEAEIADYSDLGWDELLAKGYLEDNRKMHAEIGLYYLIDDHCGKGKGRTSFYIFLKKEAKSLADLKGRKIRVFPAISPFIKALDAHPILMKSDDIYIGLDRGTIDGFVDINVGIVDDYHYEEICKSFIPYGFYRTPLGILINMKAWNRLSKDLQDKITKYTETEVVNMWQEYFDKTNHPETEKLIKAGIKPVQWSEADKKKYLATAYKAGWESVEKESPGFIKRYAHKYWLHYK